MNEVKHMNIAVLNGSPRKNGNTVRMINAFSKGAQEAGHTVNVIDIQGKNIAGCIGCYHCISHGGECAQKDDMQGIYEQLNGVDMLVWASPIYWYDITAQLKTVIDRLFATAMTGNKPSKMALLLDAQGKDPFTAAKRMYKESYEALKAENMGIVTISGTQLDARQTDEEKFAPAYQLGKSL